MKKKNKGLSLLELVVSILVTSLLIFSVFQLFTSGMRFQTQSKTSAKLSMLAQKQMEAEKDKILKHTRPSPFSRLIRVSPTPFLAPDGAFKYSTEYYTYQAMVAPGFPCGGNVNDKYIVAIVLTVDGPYDNNGKAMMGYKSTEVVSFVAARDYAGAYPDEMPADPWSDYVGDGNGLPPPPTPMTDIVIPPSP